MRPHSRFLRSLALSLFSFLALPDYLSAAELPRFDHWQLFKEANQQTESRDQWDLEFFLAAYRALPNLTAEESASLRVFPAMAAFLEFAPTPATEETQRAAIEELETLTPRHGPPQLPLEIAAEEALFVAYMQFPWRLRDNEKAVEHAMRALEAWEVSDRLELARTRYIRLVRALPLYLREHISWEEDDTDSPLDSKIRQMTRRALEIASEPEDVCHLHYRLAKMLENRAPIDRPAIREEALHHYEAAFALLDPAFTFARQLIIDGANFLDRDDGTRAHAVEWTDYYLAHIPAENDWQHRRVENLRDSIVNPSLSVRGPNNVLPGSAIELQVTARNVAGISLTVRPIEISQILEAFPKPTSVVENAPVVFEVSPEVNPARPPHADHHWQVNLPMNLEPGIYQVTARSGEFDSNLLIVISESSISLQSDGKTVLAQARNGTDSTPIKEAQLEVVHLFNRNDNNQPIVVRTSEQSDTAGLVWFEIPYEPNARHEASLVVLHGAQPAICQIQSGWYWNNLQNKSLEVTLHAYTDRPLYRPGDKVSWKAIARGYEPGELTVPEGMGYTIRATQHFSDYALEPSKGKLNHNGTLSGDFTLPADAPLGTWFLAFEADGEMHGKNSATSFSVEEFRLPDFRAEIELPESPIERGTIVEGTVNVSAYSGEPLVGAKVSVVVIERADGEVWESPSESRSPRPEPRVIEFPLQLTDKEGKVSFAFEARYSEASELRYQIETKITDPSERTIHETRSLSTYRDDLTTELSIPHALLEPEDDVGVTLKTTRHDGTPRSVSGRLTLERLTDFDTCQNEPTGTPIASEIVETNASGTFSATFTVKAAGVYRISWFPQGSHTMPRKLSLPLYVGEPEELFDPQLRTRPRVIIDQPLKNHDGTTDWIASPFEHCSVMPDQSVPYLILTSGKPTSALLSLYSDRLEAAMTVPLRGLATRGELSIPKEFGREGRVHFDLISEGNPLQQQFNFDIKHSFTPLKVEVEAGRSSLRPGTEQTLEIAVYSPDGAPAVGAEVSISVYDEALMAFGDDRSDLKEGAHPSAFLPRLRHSWIQTEAGSIDAFRSISGLPVDDAGAFFELSPFEVQTSSDGSYYATTAISGTRIMSGINDLPLSLEVINSKLLEDSGSADFADSLQYSSGVFTGQSFESAPIELRRDFRPSAYWTARAEVDADGLATVRFPLPDLPTSWRVEAIAVGPGGADIGAGETTFTTTLPVVGNLRLPRFLVEGDEAELSVLARNNSDEALPLRLSLSAEGALEDAFSSEISTVEAGESLLRSWKFRAETAGEARITAAALSPIYSDGMFKTLEVIPHGIQQQVIRQDVISDETCRLTFELPEGADPDSLKLEIAIETGDSAAIARALPYLIDYPYHCVEQTTSRLVPVERFIKAMTQVGHERASVLSAIGFDSAEAYAVFRATALRRLEETYNYAADAWGWFSAEHPDPYMTAYTYWGLMLARADGLELFDPELLDDVGDFLDEALEFYERDLRTRAWILYAALSRNLIEPSTPTENEQLALAECLDRIEELDLSARAWVALAAHSMGREADAEKILGLIQRQARHSTAPGTGTEYISWGSNQTGEYSGESRSEASAWVLELLQTMAPESPLIAPTRDALLASRESNRWESTRATMIALTALQKSADNAETHAGATASTLHWSLNESAEKPISMPPRSLRATTWQIPAKLLRAGSNELIVSSDAQTPLRVTATLSYFDRSAFLSATSSGLAVKRQYFRIRREPTLLNGSREVLVPLDEGESLTTGEEIEVCLTLETPIDLAYLLIEDRRPAGTENLRQTSGFGAPLRQIATTAADGTQIYSGRERWTYLEPRDQLCAAFLDALSAGTWEWRYRVHAETAGTFHALPAQVEVMYAPQFRGSSDETLVEIKRRTE
jgi:hypothetical protein